MSARAYRLFDVRLKARQALTPSLHRFTFIGPEVDRMRACAPDQRIKILFPYADGRAPDLIDQPDWYAGYKRRPMADRPPIRTYTIRALRPSVAEVDVEFVLHGETGPATRWATRAEPGDTLQFVAPDRGFPGDPGGYEWKPPAGLRRLLLIADETALPAVAGILEELAAHGRPPAGQLFAEIPGEDDRIVLPSWPGLEVEWMPRHTPLADIPPGANLVAAARRARLPSALAMADDDLVLADVNLDVELTWERAAPADAGFYAWVAGESAAVLTIRNELVRERRIDRRQLNLMGYWREGRVLE